MSPWQRYLDGLVSWPSLGFSLDVSRIEPPGASSPAPSPERVGAAFAAMDALEKGAIANPDEGRRVGHYWLRDPSLAPTSEIRTQIAAALRDVLALAAEVHDGSLRPERGGRFANVLVVGIGGSALGPQFVASALGALAAPDRMRVFFFDNTDPDGFDRTLASIGPGLTATLTVVISKSGGTKETRNGMLEAARAYERAGLTFAKHAVAVTGEGSELDCTAAREQWLRRLPMWDWVGGRTSELSAVGLLPAALQGIDVRAMLRGARAMDAATRVPDARTNLAMRMALAWWTATDGAGRRDMVVLPYKDRLELFSRYLQQLVMESLGKERDLSGAVVHQGIAVYGNKGSTDQHAYVQQLRDGVANFFVTFIRVLHDRDGESREVDPGVTSGDYLFGFLEGTRQALYDSGRPSITLTLDRVEPASVGALIALYERSVGFYASLVGINAYHQPGVEAGKRAATAVLELQHRVLAALRAGGEHTAEQLARTVGTSETETVWKILHRLAVARPSRRVRMAGDPESPASVRFAWEEMRHVEGGA